MKKTTDDKKALSERVSLSLDLLNELELCERDSFGVLISRRYIKLIQTAVIAQLVSDQEKL